MPPHLSVIYPVIPRHDAGSREYTHPPKKAEGPPPLFMGKQPLAMQGFQKNHLLRSSSSTTVLPSAIRAR